MSFVAIIDTPIGKLGMKTQQETLLSLHFLPANTTLIRPDTSLTKTITEQLQAYFAKKLIKFDLPCHLIGTDYQIKVWNHLCSINPGTTKSYGILAEELTTGSRAIGNACRRNPIPIIFPCHRVVAKSHVGGYSGAVSGDLLNIKQWLLQHERND